MVLNLQEIKDQLQGIQPESLRDQIARNIARETDETRQQIAILLAIQTYDAARNNGRQEAQNEEGGDDDEHPAPPPPAPRPPAPAPQESGGLLSPVLPTNHREAFMEGAGIAATTAGTALATNAVLPHWLGTTAGAGIAPFLTAGPALGAWLGYMYGSRTGNKMTGMAVGGLSGAALSAGIVGALNPAMTYGGMAALGGGLALPVLGAVGGWQLGKQFGHPVIGLAGGAALSTYISSMLLGGAAASTMAPILAPALALGAAGLAAYIGADHTKRVWNGEGNLLTTNTIGIGTGLIKGFLPWMHDKLHGVEHLTAVPGQLMHGFLKGVFEHAEPKGRAEYLASIPGWMVRGTVLSPWNALIGLRKAITFEPPEGVVQNVVTAPTRLISGFLKGFGAFGGKPEGVVEKVASVPSRFMKWLVTPQE